MYKVTLIQHNNEVYNYTLTCTVIWSLLYIARTNKFPSNLVHNQLPQNSSLCVHILHKHITLRESSLFYCINPKTVRNTDHHDKKKSTISSLTMLCPVYLKEQNNTITQHKKLIQFTVVTFSTLDHCLHCIACNADSALDSHFILFYLVIVFACREHLLLSYNT